jgi:hypothetical protein
MTLKKEEILEFEEKKAQDLTLWRTRFGRGREPATRRNDD